MQAAYGARVYMDAVVRPNRSLSPLGFKVMLAVLLAYNALVMGFLLLIGAFPVPIFLGLDVVGLLVAFRISNRRAGWSERVRVTALEVQVWRRRPPRADETVWSSPTALTRVALDHAGEHEARVRLSLSGRSLQIASALSPEERGDFADALERAIRTARGERG